MSLTIQFPPTMALATASSHDAPLALNANWAYQPTSGKYVGITTTFSSPIVPVRSTSIKNARIRDVLVAQARAQLGAANGALAAAHPAIKSYFKGSVGRRPAAATLYKPTQDQLAQALAIHAMATAIGDFSVLAVARSFGLTHTQAKYWVAKARRSGRA